MGRPAAPGALALYKLPGQLLTVEDVEGDKWYQCISEWPAPGPGGLRGSVEQWRAIGEEALSSATRAYEKKVGGGDASAARALGKEQTVGDRIASVTLRVQESPVHRVDELRVLLSYARKKGRRERLPAIEALKDLFINDLLPPDRRLVRFQDREFECAKNDAISKRHAAYAMFEEELKVIYREFLEVVEECGKDTLQHFKQKAVKVNADLLVAKPESEKELLSMLVNKLGDPDRKVSSTASFCLLRLIQDHHPQMRLIVVREVQQLLLRPNITPKAQYFSVCFLNQIPFAKDDVELARWLLRIYMELFATCLAREKQSNGPKEEKKPKQKVKKARWKKTGQKAQTPARKEPSTEAKESRLMGSLLIGANRAYPYTKPQEDETSYKEHFDALFEVAHAKALGPATQALSFLFRVSQSNATQSDRFYRALYARIHDASEAGDPKQARFLSLLYKAMRVDTDPRRVKAYAKRLLQAALNGRPGFAGSCAVVLSECFKGRQLGALKSYISVAEGEDEVEEFFDADKSGPADAKAVLELESGDASGNADKKPSNVRSEDGSTIGRPTGSHRYDPAKRDPQYAGAERSCLWELVTMCNHFHPSVSKFAMSMCVQFRNVQYGGDPLKDFSEIAFLDKFVYKKPKNRVTKSLYGKRAASYRDDPLANSAEFQELAKAGNIGEDDKFFTRFFNANPDRVVKPEADVVSVTAAGAGKSMGDALGLSDTDEELGAESEEEAFEKAMQAEMNRLGADAGFASEGIKKVVADVDEEDEDELQAFEKAFEDDMLQSDDGKEAPEVEALDALQASEGEEDRDNDGPVLHAEKKKGKKGKKGGKKKRRDSESVFAAAADYREAIDAEAAKGKRELGDDGDEGLVEGGTAFVGAKRKQGGKHSRPKKKRKK